MCICVYVHVSMPRIKLRPHWFLGMGAERDHFQAALYRDLQAPCWEDMTGASELPLRAPRISKCSPTNKWDMLPLATPVWAWMIWWCGSPCTQRPKGEKRTQRSGFGKLSTYMVVSFACNRRWVITFSFPWFPNMTAEFHHLPHLPHIAPAQ